MTSIKQRKFSYLRAYKAHHSTIVENVLQISLFMQNKPNSPIVQTDVTSFTTMHYAIFTSLTKVKNKPNQTQFKPISNPIQTQNKPNSRKAKNERKYLFYKGI